MKALLTTTEAAQKLGVSRRRVEQLISSGQLPAQKLGRDWTILESDVQAYVPQPVGNPNWRKSKPP